MMVGFAWDKSLLLGGGKCRFKLMCLAIPGKVTSIAGSDPLLRTGKIDFGGVLKEASLAYVPEAIVGDYVLVHAGFAISRLDEEEAAKVFDYLRQISDLGENAAGSLESR
jgi:hydrogenase expression/formation protein HypC